MFLLFLFFLFQFYRVRFHSLIVIRTFFFFRRTICCWRIFFVFQFFFLFSFFFLVFCFLLAVEFVLLRFYQSILLRFFIRFFFRELVFFPLLFERILENFTCKIISRIIVKSLVAIENNFDER